MTIDERISSAFGYIADTTHSIVFYSIELTLPTAGGETASYDLPLILIWLAAGSIFFSFYLGFINIRYFKHAIDLVRGKFDSGTRDGQISRFQALATSLSGTIGLGNIGGVAIAVSVGGPGAALWMMIMGFFAMSLKFAEAVAGVKYRHHPDPEQPHRISGGPMYFLRDSFANRGLRPVGLVLACLFAIACIFGSLGAGPLFQSNQAYQQLLKVTGGPETSILSGWGAYTVGFVIAFFAGLVIVGGIRSIAQVTQRLVPFMGIVYVLMGLFVIVLHINALPGALATIVKSAFAPEAGLGAIIGSLLKGIERGAFSNEAGLGSASIVHSAVRTSKPIAQGFVAMLGPFIDTVIVCSITALTIVITGAYQASGDIEGVKLTSDAMESGFALGPYILAFVVVLFAFSTLITWSYYGVKATTFLFGESRKIEMAYKIVFLIAIIIGAASELGKMVMLVNATVFAMSIPTIIGLYFLAPEMKRDLKKYRQSLVNKE